MLSISWPRSASKIDGPSTTAPGAIARSGTLRMRMPTPASIENFRSRISRSPEGRRHCDLFTARGDAALAKIEFQNAVGAFDADIKRHAVDRQRLAVEQPRPLRGDRSAVRSKHRRGLDACKARQRLATVGE